MSDNSSNTLNINSVGKVIARKTANDNINMPVPFLKKTGSSPQNLFIDTPMNYIITRVLKRCTPIIFQEEFHH